MKEYEYHEYANIFPMLSRPELESLAEDIKNRGLINNIVIYEGKILDGRNRYEACKIAGVQFTSEAYADTDPLGFVMSLNHKRRHMDKSALAVVATRATEIIERLRREAQERMKLSEGAGKKGKAVPPYLKGQSSDQLGKMLGVSGRTIREAEWVKKNDPEEFKKVECGSQTVTAALKQAKEKQKTNDTDEAIPTEIQQKPKKANYIPEEGMRIWATAKAILGNINKKDSQREQALSACIKYCEQRIKNKE